MSILRWQIQWWSALCLIAGFLANVNAADVEKQFKAAKANLLRQTLSPKEDVRAAAMEKFPAYPTPDAAKTLLQLGTTSQFEDVRRGSYQALLSYRNDETVGKFLSDEISTDLKRAVIEPDACVALVVLLAADEPAVQKQAQDVLTQAEKAHNGSQFLVTVVDQLGELEDNPHSVRSLQTLAESPLAGQYAGFRRAVVQSLIRQRQKEAVSVLLQLLPTAIGEVRADIQRHLAHLSGLPAADKPDWHAWWKEKQSDFKFPLVRVARRAEAAAGTPSYYGLPLYGARLVFVLDTSGSMKGGRMESAKRELVKAVTELPDGVQFNIVAFNSVVVPWQKNLVQTGPDTKKEALRFIQSCTPQQTTASYDALEAALKFDADAIYFLTDGAPNSNPVEIVTKITKINRLRRATIHAIGIQAQAGQFEGFLQSLADENFGVYRRVD
jgi:uncharacterized protein YegL